MTLYLQDVLESIANTQADEMIDPRTCEVRFELAHETDNGDLLDKIVEVTFTQRSRLTGGPLLLILMGDSDTIEEQEREDAAYKPGPKKKGRQAPNTRKTAID